MKPDSDKIKAILERKEPTNLNELQLWLGLANQPLRFIPNFSDIAAPLHALTLKDTAFYWSEYCQKNLDTIKQKLNSRSRTTLPDPSKPFVLKTDASIVARGAMLSRR